MGAASFTAVAEKKNMSDAKADNNPRIGPESAQKTLLADEIFASLAIVTPPTNGSIITDTRANLHYLCTEYGCVNLKGLTTWEKAEALINVAHPDFREELIKEAEKMHIWRRSNKI